jgi:hypothetical protein
MFDNKLATFLTAFFILGICGFSWIIYSTWNAYSNAQASYLSITSKLTELSQRKPFPNEENLVSLTDLLNKEQSNLDNLNKALQNYNIPAFNNLEKAKFQDLPQLFQDSLRIEVSRIKSLASDKSIILPPSFYLGLEEFENAPPPQDEVLSLAKQLTVLSWIANQLITHKGLILAEFSRVIIPSSSKKDIKIPTPKTPPTAVNTSSDPYHTIGTIRISFRCSQDDFRELINSITSSPYFLLIEEIQLQNTSTEPPRRDNAALSTETSVTGTNTTHRLPFIVGRELLNISLKIRSVEFLNGTPKGQPLSTTPAKTN